MSEVQAEWSASWDCPKCGERACQHDYDIDFCEHAANVKCKELVDKGGMEFEECGHEYEVLR